VQLREDSVRAEQAIVILADQSPRVFDDLGFLSTRGGRSLPGLNVCILLLELLQAVEVCLRVMQPLLRVFFSRRGQPRLVRCRHQDLRFRPGHRVADRHLERKGTHVWREAQPRIGHKEGRQTVLLLDRVQRSGGAVDACFQGAHEC
jgi:hypothetical protein